MFVFLLFIVSELLDFFGPSEAHDQVNQAGFTQKTVMKKREE